MDAATFYPDDDVPIVESHFGHAARWHVVVGELSACSGGVFLHGTKRPAESVPSELRCKRSHCRRLFEGLQ